MLIQFRRLLNFSEFACFDPISASLALGGAALSAGGTLMASGSQARALRANAPADFMAAMNEATRLKYAADESRAASQRQAMDQGAQQKQVESSLQARAAMGGGDTTDSTVEALDAGIKKTGEYHQLMSLYAGENRARGLEDQAAVTLTGAQNKYNADNYKAGMVETQGLLGAGGTLLSGAASGINSKYGQNAWDKIKSWSQG